LSSRGVFSESVVEQAALAWLEGIGWPIRSGPDIAPDMPAAERRDYGEVVLARRLRDALARLNPQLPSEALEDAFRKLTRPEGAELVQRNRALHRLLVDGATVEYRDGQGDIRGAQARVIDFDDPASNDWLAVNQFSVVENRHSRRADVVLFVNGLPLAVLELKNAAVEDATIWTAFQQLQTYKAEVPSLFAPNALLVVSDGVQARVGTLTAGREWFKPWRTVSGEALAEAHMPELQVAIEGLCAPRRFLDLVRDFLVFEDDGGGRIAKKMAGYHQFHAVQAAVAETLRAAELARTGRAAEAAGRYEAGRKPGGNPGDRRVGVVWHTQGSGKSLTMAFYAGRIIREPAMENPTVVVLTDRNDLDDQLFGTFSRCQDLLRQPPEQADSRGDLRTLLARAAGGVVFTTIHKFFPEERGDRHPILSERRNIVVIADEAHRSQYDFVDGFARHMRDALPHASFIGFTGTPIELADASTRAVFGDYISVYDIQRAVQDGATVPIYYESRLAKLALDEAERPKIDLDFEEATEGEEVERKEKLKTRWAQLEAVVGADKRLTLVARDIVEHFEQRLEAMDGKAMVVCMSRRICVDLYREIVKLRPRRHDEDDGHGRIKVVMTGSASDPPDWQPHIGNKPRREGLANRFRDPREHLPARAGAGHVAHGLRRPVAGHDVRRQAHAGPRPDAGHRAREPRVPGQAGRPGRGLPRAGARVEGGSRDLHRERRHRPHCARPGRGGRCDAGEVRGLLRALPRLRPHEVDDRDTVRAARIAAGGAGAHPRPGERQGPVPARRARAVARVRAGRPARRGAAHPRRRRVLPGGAGGARQARARRGTAGRGPRPGRAADHLSRRRAGRRRGRLRGGRAREARHLDSLGRVPGGGQGHAAAQPCCGAAAEAAQG
jgi:type I restriction enzyme R subunit